MLPRLDLLESAPNRLSMFSRSTALTNARHTRYDCGEYRMMSLGLGRYSTAIHATFARIFSGRGPSIRPAVNVGLPACSRRGELRNFEVARDETLFDGSYEARASPSPRGNREVFGPFPHLPHSAPVMGYSLLHLIEVEALHRRPQQDDAGASRDGISSGGKDKSEVRPLRAFIMLVDHARREGSCFLAMHHGLELDDPE